MLPAYSTVSAIPRCPFDRKPPFSTIDWSIIVATLWLTLTFCIVLVLEHKTAWSRWTTLFNTSVRAGENFSVHQNSSVQRSVGLDQQIARSAHPFCPPAAQFRCDLFRKTRNIWIRVNDVIFLWSSMLKLTLFSTPPCHKYKIVNSVYSPQSAWYFFQMSNSVHSVNSEISVQRKVSVGQPQFEN